VDYCLRKDNKISVRSIYTNAVTGDVIYELTLLPSGESDINAY